MAKSTISSDPVREQDKFMLRLPEGMRGGIAEAANANGRSMNAEIVARIEEYPRLLELRPMLNSSIAERDRLSAELDEYRRVVQEVHHGAAERHARELQLDAERVELDAIKRSIDKQLRMASEITETNKEQTKFIEKVRFEVLSLLDERDKNEADRDRIVEEQFALIEQLRDSGKEMKLVLSIVLAALKKASLGDRSTLEALISSVGDDAEAVPERSGKIRIRKSNPAKKVSKD